MLALLLGSVVAAHAAAGLVWSEFPGGRLARLLVLAEGRTGFTNTASAASGLLFTNRLSDEQMARNSSLMSGSGVALGDVDGDGWCDVYLCSLAGASALFRNLGGWRFEDVTAAAGVGGAGLVARGAAFADLDGDNDLDLLVTANGAGVRVFSNDGRGRFGEVTAAVGTGATTGSTSLALADVDGDGDLDLYVCNFGVNSVLRDGGNVTFRVVGGRTVVTGRMANRVKLIDGRLVEYGEPDVLYLNDGQGRFTAVPWSSGRFVDEDGRAATAPWDFGLSVQMRDLDGDGQPDIYVCNDFHTPDRVWLNRGGARFQAIPRLALRKFSTAAMGLDCADLDRDGNLDLFVVEMLSRDPARRLRQANPDHPTPPQPGEIDSRPQTGRNTLLWNRGDGTFAETAWSAGLASSDWSWMPACLDVDLDGFEDLLVVTGIAYDLMDLDATSRSGVADARSAAVGPASFPRVTTPNHAFRNRGDLTFEDTGSRWGFDATSECTALALADLDNDGDLDGVINCLNAPALLLRNQTVAPRVLVRLRGLAPNTRGIGARITVRAPGLPVQNQEILAGGRFQSADEAVRTFAVGATTNRLEIEIAWRSGRTQKWAGAEANCVYEFDEAQAAARPASTPAPASPAPMFEDVSHLLDHVHREAPFEDLDRQPLVPRRLSQLGPGVAWFDADGDGREELYLGNGEGGRLAAYRVGGNGRFEPCPLRLPPEWEGAELAGLAGIVVAPGQRRLFAAVSNYEVTNRQSTVALAIDVGGSNATPARVTTLRNPLPGSPGPLAAGDFDGDGDLDLFVGGRVIAGQYPRAAGGAIFLNEAGRLIHDPAAIQANGDLGLVSGAVFSDLTGDGRPELLLACEWGPLRLFRLDAGTLVAWDPPLQGAALPALTSAPDPSLRQLTGWWQSITTADVDGDGRLDVIAGNWGLNSAWQTTPDEPLRLWWGDFDEDGTLDILDTQRDGQGRLVPREGLGRLSAALPLVTAAFSSHRAFGQTTIDALLGPGRAAAREVRAATLASLLFLNRTNGFEVVVLPREAQWSPVFGLNAADFDGDGHQDLFLAQNFSGLPSDSHRQDAGNGLFLRGNGRGAFSPWPARAVGVTAPGEGRGSAGADFDADGRPDLVVTQNGGATRLFRNRSGPSGLRVRLAGPPSNPDGVGAQLRVKAGGKWGATHEVKAGAGYWSQDSAVLLLAGVTAGDTIEVRWPGGAINQYAVPQATGELILRQGDRFAVPP